jgi:hypothetical protein
MVNRIGDRWGKLELTDIYTDNVKTVRNGVTDIIPSLFYELTCKCGKTKSISSGMFPGRRKMRDCGCGSADNGGGRITSAYIHENIFVQVTHYAKEQGITVSKAIGQLCETALATPNATPVSKPITKPSISNGVVNGVVVKRRVG